MKKYNVWKSIYTGIEYEVPVDESPKYDGYILVRTIEK